MIENFPTDKIPKENSLAFFIVSREGWEDKRVRMRVKEARYISELAGTKVEWDNNQNFPKVGYCPPGSQKALIYGARGKPDVEKEFV